MGKGSLRGSGRAGCAVQGAVIPYSHFPTVPVCWSMALWAPRLKSILPLAICWSRGTSTDVSQDRDCKSPGSSSSLSWDGSEARSLQSSRAGYQGAGMRLQHPWKEMAGMPKLLQLSGKSPGWNSVSKSRCALRFHSWLLTPLYLLLCSFVLFETFWFRKPLVELLWGKKAQEPSRETAWK